MTKEKQSSGLGKSVITLLGGCALIYFTLVGIQYSYMEGRQAVVKWALKQPEAGYTKEDTQAMDAAFQPGLPPPLDISQLPVVMRAAAK